MTLNTSAADQPQDTLMMEARSVSHVSTPASAAPQHILGHLTPSNLRTPTERLIPTTGQTVLRLTRKGETAADYVSLSSNSPSTPSPSPKRTRTRKDDLMDVESFGYQSSESPSRIPIEPSSSKSDTPKLSYAAMTKGKGKEELGSGVSFLSQTWCKLKENDDTRIPPVTDVKYSVWLDMRELYEDQAAIYSFAATNPYVCGLSHRPASKWTEFYCLKEEHMQHLLLNSWTIGSTEVQFIKAKKLAGSRVFLKLTNVSPCHTEDEIREDIAKVLRPYGMPGEIEPHYIVDFTNEYPDVRLRTRRWDAEIFVPEETRLIMDPVPRIVGTETVIYWKGQYPVCHDCKALGHWKKLCNPTLRAQAQAAKLAKIPPAPIQTEAIQAQPEVIIIEEPTNAVTAPAKPVSVTVAEDTTTTTKTPEQTTPETTTPAGKEPQKTPVAQGSATTFVKERDIISQSRRVNIATGSAPSNETVIVRDTEGWTQVDHSKKKKRKKSKKGDQTESGTEPNKAKKMNLASTAVEVSNRPRTVGTQLQYYLYMLENGHILQRDLQNYIDKADAVTFITVTKPSMKTSSYESFTSWVGRRRRANKDDMQDIAKWKVSIPDFMNPTNPAYIDTSISAKQYKENEEQRKSKQCKLTVMLPAALSPSETEQTQEVVFRPKDRMTTVLKNIKKKFNLGFQIDLTRDDNTVLNLFVIADVAGLTDGSTVIIHRHITESSTESPESPVNEITVKVQRLTASKLWSKKFPYTTSTTHLYYEFGTQCQYKHGSFTLLRSDGSRVSRFSTLGDLQLRPNEVLIYQPEESIMIDAKWLDNKRQPQNKCVFVPHITLEKLKDVLREELLLNFNPMITVPGEVADESTYVDELTETGKLEVHIRRIGQESWDNTTFDTTPAPIQMTAIAMGDSTTRTYTVEVGPDTTVADIASMVYEDFPELKGRVFEDKIGLPYNLAELAKNIVPASGLANLRVNPMLEYSPEELARAVGFAAAIKSTTMDELLNGSYASFKP